MSRRLKRGEVAPEFHAADLDGAPVSSTPHQRWLLLSFYRYASCPMCNLRAHDLALRHGDWQAHGLDMLGVFQSPADKLRHYVARQKAPFPLVADPGQALYRLYGVEESWWGFLLAWVRRVPDIGRALFREGFLPGSVEGGIHRLPADFLIGPEDRIVEAYYGRDIGDHLPVSRIEHYLRRPVRHNDAPRVLPPGS